MYRAAILVAVVAVAATRAVAQTPSYDDLEGIVEKALQKLHTELVGEIRTNFRSIESALSESRGMEEAANRATSGRVEDVERFLRSLEERIALIERKSATEIRGLSSRIEGIGFKGVGVWEWSRGQPATRMARFGNAICVIVSIAGDFNGLGERVSIYATDGYWYLDGNAIRPVSATAACYEIVSARVSR